MGIARGPGRPVRRAPKRQRTVLPAAARAGRRNRRRQRRPKSGPRTRPIRTSCGQRTGISGPPRDTRGSLTPRRRAPSRCDRSVTALGILGIRTSSSTATAVSVRRTDGSGRLRRLRAGASAFVVCRPARRSRATLTTCMESAVTSNRKRYGSGSMAHLSGVATRTAAPRPVRIRAIRPSSSRRPAISRPPRVTASRHCIRRAPSPCRPGPAIRAIRTSSSARTRRCCPPKASSGRRVRGRKIRVWDAYRTARPIRGIAMSCSRPTGGCAPRKASGGYPTDLRAASPSS